MVFEVRKVQCIIRGRSVNYLKEDLMISTAGTWWQILVFQKRDVFLT